MRSFPLALAASLSGASFANAAQPAFVGTWGRDAAQCAVPQELQGAPMVFAKDRYDQHEAHCSFSKVSGKAPGWKISASCLVEGDRQAFDFRLSVHGEALTMTDEFGKQILKRCKSSAGN